MTRFYSLGLGLALTVALAAGSAQAANHTTSLTVGAPAVPGTGTSLPFGNTSASFGGAYQQAYDYTQLGNDIVSITGIGFSATQFANAAGAAPSTGTYTISLSSAAREFFDLSSNLAANVGANSTVVYSGALPALSGNTLTINFTTPFFYNPFQQRDLLLDVRSANAANAVPLYFDFTNGTGPAGVVTARVDGVTGFGDQSGLVTTFIEVPEPASLAILGTGLLGLARLTRRS